jgi:diacylglycerol kinase family enzyme
MKHVAVVMNRKAGSVQAEAKTKIVSAFAAHGVDAVLYEVNGKFLSNAAKNAVNNGAELVVAAGGDGTVNAVVNALIHTDTPLGVLPLGTLNHFAKDTGMPLNITDAVHVLVHEPPQRVDVGEVNGHFFVNNSSIGLYPQTVRLREKEQEQLGRSKWSAMISAALSVFRRFPTVGVRVKSDAQSTLLRTPFVFVGNNEYNMNLLELGTRSQMDTGRLSLYTARTASRWSLLRLAWSALRGELNQESDFTFHLVESVELSMKRKHTDVSLDGEVKRLSTPLHYRIHPRYLRVVIPPKAVANTSSAPQLESALR